jgi:hypothetical protein
MTIRSYTSSRRLVSISTVTVSIVTLFGYTFYDYLQYGILSSLKAANVAHAIGLALLNGIHIYFTSNLSVPKQSTHLFYQQPSRTPQNLYL